VAALEDAGANIYSLLPQQLDVVLHLGRVVPLLAGATAQQDGGEVGEIAGLQLRRHVAAQHDDSKAGMARPRRRPVCHGCALGEAEIGEPLRDGELALHLRHHARRVAEVVLDGMLPLLAGHPARDDVARPIIERVKALYGTEHPAAGAGEAAKLFQMNIGVLGVAVEAHHQRAAFRVGRSLQQIAAVDESRDRALLGTSLMTLAHARRLSARSRKGAARSCTRSSRSRGSPGSPPLSSTRRTRALPTTTPLAISPTASTCSGVEMPKPTARGIPSRLRSFLTSRTRSDGSAARSPVTPVRET